MKINGETVNKLIPIGADALILKGVDGIHFSPSSKNDYEIQIKVNEPSKYVKISSIIIYQDNDEGNSRFDRRTDIYVPNDKKTTK